MGGSEAVSQNTNLNKSKQIKIAAHLLKMSEDEAAHNSSQLSDTKALYCYSSRMGGGAIIVDVDGSVLYAASCISPETHKRDFLSGRRTDIIK